MVVHRLSPSLPEFLSALIARIGLAAGIDVQPVAPVIRLGRVVPSAPLRCPCPCSIELPDDAE
jgi:hypothetical protein